MTNLRVVFVKLPYFTCLQVDIRHVFIALHNLINNINVWTHWRIRREDIYMPFVILGQPLAICRAVNQTVISQ